MRYAKIKKLMVFAGLFFLIVNCRTQDSNINTGGPQANNISPVSVSRTSICNKLLYSENFSGISAGSRPSNWLGGSALSVKNGKLIPSIKPQTGGTDHQIIIKEIYFPENFELSIKMGLSRTTNPIVFQIGNLRVAIQRHLDRININGRFEDREVIKANISGAEFIKPISSGFGKKVKLDLKDHDIVIKNEKSVTSLTLNNTVIGSIAIPELKHIEGMMFRYIQASELDYFEIKSIDLCGDDTPIQMVNAKQTLYIENFRGTDIGRIPEGWIDGSTFAVQESQRFSGNQEVVGKRVLRRMRPGKESFTINNIPFSTDFKIDFEMIVVDTNGLNFTVAVGDICYKIGGYGENYLGPTTNIKSGVKFNSAADADRKLLSDFNGFGRDACLMTLTKIENIFRLYLNSREVAFIRVGSYNPSNSISYSGGENNKIGIYSIKVTEM